MNSFASQSCSKYLEKRKTWQDDDFEKLTLVAYITGAYDLYVLTHAKVRAIGEDSTPDYYHCLRETNMNQRLDLIHNYCKKHPNYDLLIANSNVFFDLAESCIKKIK